MDPFPTDPTAITSAHLSSGMMSPPIPVMGLRLPDIGAEAYVANLTVPNVQVVQG